MLSPLSSSISDASETRERATAAVEYMAGLERRIEKEKGNWMKTMKRQLTTMVVSLIRNQ